MKNMCKKAVYLEDAIEEINKIYNRIELIREKHPASLLGEYTICLAEEWGVIEALKSIPSITDDPVKWTPCSEGPPKEESEVLVTTSWNDVCKAWYSNGKWRAEFTDEYDDDEILAWMPLPKPYRKDDD